MIETEVEQKETDAMAENSETEVNAVNAMSESEKIDKSASYPVKLIGYDELDNFGLPTETGRYLMTIDENPESGENEITDLVKVNVLETIPTTSFVETNEEYTEEEAIIDETNEEYLDIDMLHEEEAIADGADNEINVNVTKNHIIQPKNRGGRPAHGPQVCDVRNCGKTFRTKCRLDEHKLTHGPKNFVCNECDKRYHTQKLLNEHFRDSKKHKKDRIE